MIPYLLAAIGGYLIGQSRTQPDYVDKMAGGGTIYEAQQVAREDIDSWSDDEVAEYLGIQEDEVDFYYREKAIRKRTDYYVYGIGMWDVTITSKDGETYDWLGWAKNEEEAQNKAEKEAGFESVETFINLIEVIG